MRPLVLLDVDGVLADFITPAFKIANGLLGTDHKPDDLDIWDMAEWLKLEKHQSTAFYDAVKLEGFHDDLPVYPGAVEGVKRLQEIADVHIVTSPMYGKTWCSERWNWLYKHFGIKSKDVTHTHAKHYFRGDFLVDDKPENVLKWQSRNAEGTGLLWDQKYNWALIGEKVFIRVQSWNEVLEHVENWAP